jgi:hypothetical protein
MAIKITKRGRKFCLDSLWSTQRPASISKDVVSQCNRFWLGGIKGVNDYTAVKTYLENAGIDQQTIMSAEPGQFYLFGEQKQTIPLRSRKKHSRDAASGQEGTLAGFTPKTTPQLAEIATWLREGIAQGQKIAQVEQTALEKAQFRINQLEKEVDRLRQQNQLSQAVRPMVETMLQRKPEQATRLSLVRY